ncbi:MAG: class I SAM-dependent methyltransferase [Actinomycetota bacterium]|nr:class I SAM-dependent methyltransferase [Actinomycetota bacterium]
MATSGFRDRVKRAAAPARRLARRALSVPSGSEYGETITRFDDHVNSVDSHANTIEARVDALCEVANDLRARIATLTELSNHTADRQADTLESLLAAGQRTSRLIDALDHEQQRHTFELTDKVYLSSPHLLDVTAPDGGTTLGFDSTTPLGGADYRSLEDVLRGSEQFIRERLRFYLKFFASGEAAVDLGSGRGEMLELLAEGGIDAVGVDLDPSMVARAEVKGLRCTQADALEWLRDRDKKSLDVVFSTQFLEHIPTGVLPDLLGTARECLRPGGRFIAETVNPYSPSALRAFWVDLTHVQPLYPETLLVLLQQAGYTSAYVVYPTSDKEPEIARTETGEYAIVATT